jgi:hypothetical protein
MVEKVSPSTIINHSTQTAISDVVSLVNKMKIIVICSVGGALKLSKD